MMTNYYVENCAVSCIKYLVKFVPEYPYAECLVDGCLFMRPAMYFHQLEEGQGDEMEGAIDNSNENIALYKGWSYPIYCLYSVFDGDYDLEKQKYKVSSKAIHDFKCEDGFAVVLDPIPLLAILKKNVRAGQQLEYDLVNYANTSPNNTLQNLLDSNGRTLFTKAPKFKHQHEFRIVLPKALFAYPKDMTEHEAHHEHLGGSLVNISDIVPVSRIITGENKYNLLAV